MIKQFDGSANEASGYSVSMSYVGTTITVVSGTYENRKTRIHKLTGNTWDTTVINGTDQDLWSVVCLSSDGTTVALAAPRTGIITIYKWNSQNSSWNILGSQITGGANNEFGFSVSLSSDGTIVAIGAPAANSSTGMTRIYKWNSSSWIMLGSQINGLNVNDSSGYSVSLSSDGTTVAIGAPNTMYNSNKGFTRIYKLTDQTWVMNKHITGEGGSGHCVSLSSDGITIAIGNVSVVLIYKWNGQDWVMTKQIDGDSASYSGRSSISSDGTVIAIGAPNGLSYAGTTRIYKYI